MRGSVLKCVVIYDMLLSPKPTDLGLNWVGETNLKWNVSMLPQWIQRPETVSEGSVECFYLRKFNFSHSIIARVLAGIENFHHTLN